MNKHKALAGRVATLGLGLGLVLSAFGLGLACGTGVPEAEAQSCNRQCPPAEKDGRGCCKTPAAPPPKPPSTQKPPPPKPPPTQEPSSPPPPPKDPPKAAAAPADCGDGMAGLPGGSYVMGENKNTVEVKPFCLDLTEVTASAYAACVKAGDCSEEGTTEYDACNAGKGRGPMNCVDWKQAKGFCEAQGKRLPSEAEWEWAARGGDAARKFPWGNEAPDNPEDRACWSGGTAGKREGTCTVGSFPTGNGRFGHKDLSGSVYEWTSDRYHAESPARVIRGGGWDGHDASWLSASYRSGFGPSNRISTLGLRCAR